MSLFDFALRRAERRWPSKTTIGLLLLAVFLAMVLFFIGADLTTITRVEWAITTGVLGVLWLFWYFTTRPPRRAKHTVGIGVAIACDDSEAARHLHADLVDNLRELLGTRAGRYAFDLVVFDQEAAQKLETVQAVHQLREVSDVHLLLWGRSKARRHDGDEVAALKLDGVVVHRSVASHLQAEFQEEFAGFLPRKILVPRRNDILGVAVTADWTAVVARYVVGVAALFSLDLDYAEDLLRPLEQELATRNNGTLPVVAKLRPRVKHRLGQLYTTRIVMRGVKYIQTRNPAFLVELEPDLERVAAYRKLDWNLRTYESMCHFVLRRDVGAARRALQLCTDSPDGTWLFNLAFLSAYEGDLTRAEELYAKANRKRIREKTVPLQLEEFMTLVVQAEPERFHLYYLLGLLNHQVKDDPDAALRDFSAFLHSCPEGVCDQQQKTAAGIVEEIEQAAMAEEQRE